MNRFLEFLEFDVLSLSKMVLFLSIAFAFIYTPLMINRQLTSIHNDVTIQLTALRSDTVALVNKRADAVQTQVSELFDKTDRRIGSFQKDLFVFANGSEKDLDTRIDILTVDFNNQLIAFNNNMNNQETVLNTNIADVTGAYAPLPSQLAARFDRQTNCDKNGLCWQNMVTDTLANLRFTGRDISASTKVFNENFPKLLFDFGQITDNTSAITANFRKLTNPKWYDRLIGYGLNAAVIYRNLNPITSVALTGAQLISSRP